MAHRNKNLLEAFTASRAEERTGAPKPPQVKGAQPAAGGPFASSSAPTARPQPAPAVAAPAPRPEARAATAPQDLPRRLGILALVALACFFLGRWSVSGVAAAPSSDGSSGGAGEVSDASRAGLQGRVPQSTAPGSTPEAALMNPKNRYTIVAAQYSSSAQSQEIALAAQRYLVAQGFPAALPYVKGKNLYLVVGAAEEMAKLDELLSRLKKLPGPGGKPDDFKTALVMPIEQIVQR
jgi:hypothetical protein